MPSEEFLISTEQECLTALVGSDDSDQLSSAVSRLVEKFRQEAPSLRCGSGFFNPYGRVYVDCGHIELAIAECDSPYALALTLERQQMLAARASEKLAADGPRLILANNNHDGLLTNSSAIWGSHENYLVERHPDQFGQAILPFLVTRIYGGSGGIHHPSGNLFASVRANYMDHDTGGSTTENRAIHSTSREEHLVRANSSRYRYHLILGDGHRSQFNTALAFGATALAIKAVLFDSQLGPRARRLCHDRMPRGYVGLLRELNILAKPGQPPTVDPLVIEVQRLYLDGAVRWLGSLECPPDWCAALVEDWGRTLDALASGDRGWLSARLDTFAKYEAYSAVLADAGATWKSLPGRNDLFIELALLDHSYHTFTDPNSLFRRLDEAGLLAHRINGSVAPGDEPQAFVPETTTRARPRAEFICEHAGSNQYMVDWTSISEMSGARQCETLDPFAQTLGPWQSDQEALTAQVAPPAAGDVMRLYQQGEYERAHRLLRLSQTASESDQPASLVRCAAWLKSRRGFLDGASILEQHYAEATHNMLMVSDFCCVYRFLGLTPPRAIDHWIDLGRRLLADGDTDPGGTAAFHEHWAYTLLRRDQLDAAREVMEEACSPRQQENTSNWVRVRQLATRAEILRRHNEPVPASAYLIEAEQLAAREGFQGTLASEVYTGLARLSSEGRAAQRRLQQALEIQRRHRDHMGQLRSQLLLARISDDDGVADACHRLVRLRRQLPALAECELFARIANRWDDWTSGAPCDETEDAYWGL